MPPTTMMPLMAFVTLISGVCSAGVTFQITCQPMKHASTNTVRCGTNSGGASTPAVASSPTTTARPTRMRGRAVSGRPRLHRRSAGAAGLRAARGGAGGFGGGHMSSPSFSTSAPRPIVVEVDVEALRAAHVRQRW